MTVSYTAKVATNYGLGGFLKLLLRWRGSVYKLVWFDLLMFLGIYYTLNLTYLFALNDTSKQYFKKIVRYCHDYGELIPLSFVLGFFVSLVYNRWWSQFKLIPFPDSLAILVGASIKGKDEQSRIVRRTIIRYACVSTTMTLTLISPKVKKRFPTLKHFVNAGLLSEEEANIVTEINKEYPGNEKYWLPLAWASSITTRARHEGIIKEDTLMKGILEELNDFRNRCHEMLDYDWISIPLVYTQVVTLAVYGYFLTTVIGHQFIDDTKSISVAELLIFSFPFLPIVEFFFYMGWLKVAETLMNPYGDDDDDFEVMWMIDRNIQIGYILVDRIHQAHPKLIKDAYWDVIAPSSLPFTVASQEYISEYPEFSTKDVKVKHLDQDVVIPEYITQSDPIIKAPGIKTYKRNGRLLRTRPSQELFSLNQIFVANEAHNNETENKLKKHKSDTDLQDNTPQTSNDDDFNSLREERLKQHQEKILNYIQLLKTKSDKSQHRVHR